MTRDAIMNWLAGKSKPYYDEQPLINSIQRYKLAFQPTEEDIQKIKNAGGSPELIDLIQGFVPAQPAIKPEPESMPAPVALPLKMGLLTVDCRPIECTVLINNGPFRFSSAGGTLSLNLREGGASVAAFQQDYDPFPNQQAVDIRANKPAVAVFKFTPSPAALARVGQNLFVQMVAALGGPAGLKEAETLQGTGELASWANGNVTSWGLTVALDRPDKRKYLLAGRGQKLEFKRTADGFQAKPPQAAEIPDLDQCLRWFQDNELPKFVANLQGGSFQMTAEQLAPPQGQPAVLKAMAGNRGYRIVLDSSHRPAEITVESAGLDRGRKILYSDYLKYGNASYPKHIQIMQPDDARHGVELRFEELRLGIPAGKSGKKSR